MVFFHALEGVISIMLMVSVGYYLASRGWFSPESSRLLPRLVNYVALPTYMVWNLMSTFDESRLVEMIYGLVVPFASMLTSFVIGCAVSRLIGIAPHHRGTFRSVFFCSSSVFVGIPVNLALFGETSIPYVLLYFLANAFLFWTIGNYSISMDGKTAPAKIFCADTVKKICSPPFLGFMSGTALILLNIHLPDFIMNTAKYLGNMTTPLSMLFIGIVMYGVKIRDIRLDKDILAVLAGRFIVSPLAVLLVASFLPIPGLMRKVFVIQAALPAMTQTTIMSKVYEADTEYAAVMVTITTLAAMVAIPVYMVFL